MRAPFWAAHVRSVTACPQIIEAGAFVGLYIFYMLIMLILLVNMFVAMLNNTFNALQVRTLRTPVP